MLGLERFGIDTRDILWGAILFVVLLVGSAGVLAVVIVKLPAGYFADEPPPGARPNWAKRILKNLAGAVLVIIGALLSLPGVPGQGFLTILIGLMIMDFPGKRRFELWIIKRPGILDGINKVREKAGKPPMYLPR